MRFSQLVPWKHESVIRVLSGHQLGKPSDERWIIPTHEVMKSRLYLYCLLVCLGMSKYMVGLANSMIGPALPDLVHQMNTTVEVYSRSLASKGFFLLAGLPVASLVLDSSNHYVELVLASILLVNGVTTAVIPWCDSTVLLTFIFGIQGFCIGNIHVLTMVVTVRLYGKKGGTPLGIISTLTGVGRLSAPAITGPFITQLTPAHHMQVDPGDSWKQNAAYHVNNSSIPQLSKGNDTNTTTVKGAEWTKHVYIPFAIYGAMALLNAFGYVLAYNIKSDSQHKDVRTKTNKKTNHDCPMMNLIAISCALIIMYTSLMTCIVGLEYFLYSVAVFSRLNFSREEAVSLVTVFFICLTVGRFGSALLLQCISIKLFCNVTVILATVTGIFLAGFGLYNHAALWILASVFIYLLAPLYAAGYAYADRFIEVTGRIAAMMEFGMGCGFNIAAWLLAKVFDLYGAQGILVTVAVNSAVCCCTVISILIGGTLHGDRYEYQTVGNDDRSVSEITDQENNN